VFLLVVSLCLTLGLYAIVVNVLAYQGNVLSSEANVLTREGKVLVFKGEEAALGTPGKPVGPSQTTTVRVTPSIQSVSPGATFSVTVEIVDVLDLGAFEFRLNYTQSCVQQDGVELGAFLGSTGRQAYGQIVGSGDGWLHYGAYSVGSAGGPNGDGALAIITFRTSSSQCQSALQLQDAIVTDIAGVTIAVSTENGQVTVEQIQPPHVTSISPSWGYAGQTIASAIVRGQHFQQGASVQLTKAGSDPIYGTFASVQNTTTISCSLNLGRAVTGAWNVVVTNPDSQAGTLPSGFTVRQPPPPPVVTSITPSRACIHTVASITNLAGSRFQPGATVKLTRAGSTDIVATNVTVVSASQIRCQVNLNGAARGLWSVVVTNPDGQSGTLPDSFAVQSCVYVPIAIRTP